MVTSNVGPPRGILNPGTGQKKFQLSLHAPAPDLQCFVEHYWIVSWDLRGQDPYLSETLPHPCIHLVFEQNQSRIVGVMRGKFSTLLTGRGRVFGVKFRPGAFYPFVRASVSTFTNTSTPPWRVFGQECSALETVLLSQDDEQIMVQLVEQFLCARLPAEDENVGLLRQIVDRIITEREITSVDEIASQFALTRRTLQRLFSQYVGVSPKWVIKRYRLHEAAERLAGGEIVDWPALAQDLGYFDQAHFIKDFKNIVGTTPADYAKKLDLDCF